MDKQEKAAYDFMNKEEDLINKPSHYHKGGIDPIAVMESKFTPEMLEGFFAGNAIKYVIRYPDKGKPIEDLEKAQFYINKLIGLQKNKFEKPNIADFPHIDKRV